MYFGCTELMCVKNKIFILSDDDCSPRPRDNRCRSPGSPPCGSPGGLKVPGSQGGGGLGRIARLLTKEPRGDNESYRRRTHSLER